MIPDYTQPLAKALFLDRDGIINEDVGYLYKKEDVSFIPGIFELCRYAKSQNYLIVVVTNQAGIAREYYMEFDFHMLMNWMRGVFIREGCPLDIIYYSPFHPLGSRKDYAKASEFRKPSPGMLIRAQSDLGLDLSSSILMGDKVTDIEAGHQAGVGTLVLVSSKELSNLASFHVETLYDALRIIEEVGGKVSSKS